MFGRLLLAVVASAGLGAGLWAAGERLLGDDEETAAEAAAEAASDGDTIPADVWARRVGVICKSEKKHTRALLKALRSAYTYADAELWMIHVNKVGQRSVQLFRRLPPPEGFERDRRDILRLLKRKQAVGRAMVEAVRQHEDRAFFRHGARMVKLSERVNRILVRLSVDGCVPLPKEKLPTERRLVV